MDDSRTNPAKLFAARLNQLFEDENRRRPEGERLESSHVAEAIGVSRQAIHALRNPEGGGRGPSFQMITLLAGFFNTEPNWFFRPLTEEPAGDELTHKLATLGVTHVAANQVGEDLASMKRTVLDVLAQIERIEGQMRGQGGTGAA